MKSKAIKVDFMKSPWRNKDGPTREQIRVFGKEGTLPTFETLHASLRVGSTMFKEIGYLLKRIGGLAEVREAHARLIGIMDKHCGPFIRIMASWVFGGAKGAEPPGTMYSCVVCMIVFVHGRVGVG
jgi:hypothetical protein